MCIQMNPPTRQAIPCILLSHQTLNQSLDVLAKGIQTKTRRKNFHFPTGGMIGCFSQSLNRLLSDIAILRPTAFGSIPTFWQNLKADFDRLEEENKENVSGTG